jgi:hypothetical protein
MRVGTKLTVVAVVCASQLVASCGELPATSSGAEVSAPDPGRADLEALTAELKAQGDACAKKAAGYAGQAPPTTAGPQAEAGDDVPVVVGPDCDSGWTTDDAVHAATGSADVRSEIGGGRLIGRYIAGIGAVSLKTVDEVGLEALEAEGARRIAGG